MTVYPPTPKQQRVLDYLRIYTATSVGMPTVREICYDLEIRSTSSVHGIIKQLEKRGYIERLPHMNRAIALVPQVDLKAENERLRAALQELINANFDADAQRANKALEHAMAVWAACAPPATCDSLPPATRPAVDSGGM